MEYQYDGELPVTVSELKESGIIGNSEVMFKGKRVEIDEKYKTLIRAMDVCPLFKK